MPDDSGRDRQPEARAASEVPLRVLLTGALVAAGVVPVAMFGAAVMLVGPDAQPRVILLVLVVSLVSGGLFGFLLAASTLARLTSRLRRITTAMERVAAGAPGPALRVAGDDELAGLAESHNEMAAEVRRRNQELARLLDAIGSYGPAAGVEALRAQAEKDACPIFGLIDCSLRLVAPGTVPVEERVPGDPMPVRAEVRVGRESIGLLTGHLPATRSWESADQDLLDLFGNAVGVALRNADLFAQIDKQNARLRELDAAKDEFLRGVSHNLQTPLTSIRAYVDLLRTSGDEASRPEGKATNERRLDIVAEQTDRLTRLVRQLLTVTRLEAGVLKSQPEIMAIAPRVRRAWEALNAQGVAFELQDEAKGWLAVADADQVDQIVWALLDNAVKYGGRTGTVKVRICPAADGKTLETTIADHGPGVPEQDRHVLFTRFTRGATQASGEGTGLGLYVSRQLARGMEGDLWLEPAQPGVGAAFTFALPGEPAGIG